MLLLLLVLLSLLSPLHHRPAVPPSQPTFNTHNLDCNQPCMWNQDSLGVCACLWECVSVCVRACVRARSSLLTPCLDTSTASTPALCLQQQLWIFLFPILFFFWFPAADGFLLQPRNKLHRPPFDSFLFFPHPSHFFLFFDVVSFFPRDDFLSRCFSTCLLLLPVWK